MGLAIIPLAPIVSLPGASSATAVTPAVQGQAPGSTVPGETPAEFGDLVGLLAAAAAAAKPGTGVKLPVVPDAGEVTDGSETGPDGTIAVAIPNPMANPIALLATSAPGAVAQTRANPASAAAAPGPPRGATSENASSVAQALHAQPLVVESPVAGALPTETPHAPTVQTAPTLTGEVASEPVTTGVAAPVLETQSTAPAAADVEPPVTAEAAVQPAESPPDIPDIPLAEGVVRTVGNAPEDGPPALANEAPKPTSQTSQVQAQPPQVDAAVISTEAETSDSSPDGAPNQRPVPQSPVVTVADAPLTVAGDAASSVDAAPLTMAQASGQQQAVSAPSAPTAAAPPAMPAAAPPPTEQLAQAVIEQLAPDGGEVTVRLDPPELGEVTLRMTVKDHAVHVEALVARPHALGVLRDSQEALVALLNQGGLELTDVFVGMQQGQSQSGAQDSAGRQDTSGAFAAMLAGDDEGSQAQLQHVALRAAYNPDGSMLYRV